MQSSDPFSVTDYSALLRFNGTSSLLPIGAGPPPSDEGLNVGLAELDQTPPHGGECHPQGDEMIILISGELSIVLEEEETRTVRLNPNEAFIVPRATWHRLLVHSPSRLIYLTPGPSQWRPLASTASEP